jgi:hypothetical protein
MGFSETEPEANLNVSNLAPEDYKSVSAKQSRYVPTWKGPK